MSATETVRIADPASFSISKAWLRALERTAPIGKNPTRILPTVLEERAEASGHAFALLSDRESMSYRALAERSNQYTRWAIKQGLAKGDTVCLFMPNRPEYLAVWLGITRAGCAVALLNTHLAGASLAHSIDIVRPKHIIAAFELIDPLNSVIPGLSGTPQIWVSGGVCPQFEDIDIDPYAKEPLRDDERRPVTINDRALYIYTSGTTGLPKAAIISHGRLMQWSHWFAGMLGTCEHDRLYNCLPMYHSAGGVLATGAVLASGGSVVIRDGFSAGRFWNDINRWDCTLFQYIGELCRYLVHAERNALETQHRLRACCGNGLRADIWDEFKSRFCIPRILEFYAATESNVSLFNVEDRPGSVGRIPPYLKHRFPVALVKVDSDSGEHERNDRGFCVRCGPNETGEALGRVYEDSSNVANRFEGYTSEADSKKKIVHDIFEPGDAWFRTGDLMRADEQGYFYFVDRIGDTFRWKGENVSTAEVESVLCGFPGIAQANVYAVSIPGAEGRAGMAALVTTQELGFERLRMHLAKHLPPWAHPLFLRLRQELDVTTTFKLPKSKLAREGYDPASISDRIYFHRPETGAFVPLTRELHDLIRAGEVKL